MYLFFDTETNGLPKSWNASIEQLDNWPRMIQLAWAHYSEDGRKLAEHCYIIKPEGFEIGEETAKINRINMNRAMTEGMDLDYVLESFWLTLTRTKYLVAHNIKFDNAIVGSEMLRMKKDSCYSSMQSRESICTMNSTTNFCKIEGPYGYKWPKLQELHNKLFGVDFEEAHDALVDVNAMVKCFFELKKRGLIN